MRLDTRDQQEAARTSPTQERPELPPRQSQPASYAGPRPFQGLNGQPVPETSHFAPPPQRLDELKTRNEPSAIDYTRTPRKLTGYLIPYPKPHLPDVPPDSIPQRFFIYTPPPPPFHHKPTSGKREGITQWTKRHWYQELREAKIRSPPNGSKTTRWKRLKWRGTRATNWGITAIKTSTLEFLNRVAALQDQADDLAEDVYSRTVAPEEILLIYPSGFRIPHEDNDTTPPSPQETSLRTAFLSTLHSAQRKAYKDTLLSTLLFPPSHRNRHPRRAHLAVWRLGGD